METDYQHDVFISYKRGYPFEDWVRDSFYELFEPLLEESLGGEKLRLFSDRSNISAGANWKEELRRAIAYSKCMVAIWSPRYFKSEWCQFECNVMLSRVRKTKSTLILPIIVHDGEMFPEYAKEIQSFDCRNFARVGRGFKDSKRYLSFQDKMINWTYNVAQAIKNAPPFDKNWLNDAITHFPSQKRKPKKPELG
ncbi:TIR domain-containing protein [Candidatus Magnetomoraceae bacterium gMMP-1]